MLLCGSRCCFSKVQNHGKVPPPLREENSAKISNTKVASDKVASDTVEIAEIVLK